MAPPVHITFLGGLGDIGRNCLALEQEGQILLIDCGLMFPDTDMLGVDLVLPDFTWLIERADDVVGCVVTLQRQIGFGRHQETGGVPTAGQSIEGFCFNALTISAQGLQHPLGRSDQLQFQGGDQLAAHLG